MYNHHANAAQAWYDALNNTPGLVGDRIEKPPASIHEYYQRWFEKDGYPFWPFWENIRSWWAIQKLANVKLVHFNQMKADLPGSIRERSLGFSTLRSTKPSSPRSSNTAPSIT